MIFNLKIDADAGAAHLIRRGLGLLPYDEVVGLIQDLGNQMMLQEKAASLPPDPVSPVPPASEVPVIPPSQERIPEVGIERPATP